MCPGATSAGSYVDSGQEISWNGSMCTVSLLEAEHAAALAWEADPFDTPNSLFPLRWRTIWPLRKWKLSLVHFCRCQLWSPQDRLHVSDLPEEFCADSGTTFVRHLCPSCTHNKTCPIQPPSWTYPCSSLNACCREFHCHAKSPLISAHSHH